MTEKTLRWLTILDILEHARAPLSTPQVFEALQRETFAGQCDVRTVQRDLFEMAQMPQLGVESPDPEARPRYWELGRRGQSRRVMGATAAAALKLTLEHMDRLLPPEARGALQREADRANAVLERERHNNPAARSWDQRIRLLPIGHPLRPPTLADGMLDAVFAALTRNLTLRAHYRKQGASTPAVREFSVLGLVLRPPKYQVVAYGGHKPYLLNLHRMSNPQVLDVPAQWPEGFELDDFIHSCGLDVPIAPPQRLVLTTHAALADAWRDCALGECQEISEPDSNGEVELRCEVSDTQALRAYLLSFGAQLRVHEPLDLADWLRRQSSAMAEGRLLRPDQSAQGN